MQIEWNDNDTENKINKLIQKIYHASNIDEETSRKFCKELYEMAFNDGMQYYQLLRMSGSENKIDPDEPIVSSNNFNKYVEFDSKTKKFITKEV